MIETLMIAIFLSTVAAWATFIVDSHLLLHRFCIRFPEEAKREIPYAGDWSMAHPEKSIFFRKKATEILQAAPVLLKHRKRVLMFFMLAVAVPVFGMLILVIIALATTGF